MCYVIPLAAGAASTIAWRNNRTVQMWWLVLMFYGAGLFGFIDHLWNGELFIISENWVKDLSLGFAISLAVFLAWKTILAVSEKNVSLKAYIKA